MEFYQVEIQNNWYFTIRLPYSDRCRCQYSQKVLKYIYPIHRYVSDVEKAYLYEEEVSDGVFRFQIGFALFILKEFDKELDNQSKTLLNQVVFDTSIKLPKLTNLREDQSVDLNLLMIFKRGIIQTYTGYGKSEVIVTLSNYIANTLNQKVLIITPSSKSLDEIRSRLYSRFKIDLDYFDYESNLNAINSNGFLRSSTYDPNNEYWKSPIWILADEVEYDCSETAMEFYENLPNIVRLYGFSATSDKKSADPMYPTISKEFLNSPKMKSLRQSTEIFGDVSSSYFESIKVEKSHVRDILGRNKYLIGYFGNTVVYKRPRNFKITLIDVQSTISADDIEIPQDYDYNEIIYGLFTSDSVCKLIESIAFKSGMIFIPMFRLQVIDYWLDNYFKKRDFLVLVISSRGYEMYENGEFLGLVNLDQVKVLVKLNAIGVILGTKSSYNSMDLPQLKRSILLYSKAANIVIQAIGRTARGGDFEIYNIIPGKTIHTYSKDLIERKSLIKKYYSDCDIVEVVRNENFYE